MKLPDNSPYSLDLHLKRLNCLAKAEKRHLKSFGDECNQVLTKYKEPMEGRNWVNYVFVYDHLAWHYRANKNEKMEMQTLKEGAELLPLSHLPIHYSYNMMFEVSEPLPKNIASDIEKMIELHKEANNGKLSSGMAFCKVILLKKTGKDVFPEAINFLKSYPNTIFKEIKEVADIARESISFDKPEQVKEYYNILNILAIKQPITKDRLKVIGFIINEKKKLETIMPELRK